MKKIRISAEVVGGRHPMGGGRTHEVLVHGVQSGQAVQG
jgi:hypothetical protein